MTYKFGLDRLQMNHDAKYLRQRSLRSYEDTHTQLTDYITRALKRPVTRKQNAIDRKSKSDRVIFIANPNSNPRRLHGLDFQSPASYGHGPNKCKKTRSKVS